MTERRRIGIEDALRWAYRDELPKAQANAELHVGPKQFGQAWGGVERYGELLTLIDAPSNRWGLVPDLTARGEPHADAVRIGEAVEALDECGLGLPDDWHPLGDMADLADGADLVQATIGRAVAAATVVDASGARRLRATPRHLVVKVALTGMLPDWRAERPDVMVESAHGKPRWFVREVLQGENGPYEVELDGYDRKRHAPRPGAYRKRFLDPDPLDAAVARAEWEVWRAALDVLFEDLAAIPHVDEDGRPILDREGRPVTGLEAFVVEQSVRPFRPWTEGEECGRHVFDDLTRPPAGGLMLFRGRFLPVDNSGRSMVSGSCLT